MNWTILSVSSHSATQITRNLILERAGYRVIGAGDLKEALQLFEEKDVDAVLLADSINAEYREELGTTLKRLKPAVPIVMLCNLGDSRRLRQIADEQVETEDGPQSLLEALARALKCNQKNREEPG
jgi:DNA-binding NtrC family response regulator